MGRHAFDRLGWLRLERLCDELLDDALGIAPSDWTGRLDEGRLAWTAGDVRLPVEDLALEGPVAVLALMDDSRPNQILRAAHASGAVGGSLLVVSPTAIDADAIGAVFDAVGASRPDRIAVLGPGALSRMVDASPEVRRTVPSVLGACDVRALMGDEQAARSTLDIRAATVLARVFVPTEAHARALDALRRRAFCVLSGPPEMGKTATARMLALAMLTDGWEAHECVRPEALWDVYDAGRPQIFVADDAFGSTEYHPDAAERWARDLDRVLGVLDERHWLVWTSRPAPLRAALARIARELGVGRVPRPAEVQVSADDLSTAEKALMLLAHAREAELDELGRRALAEQAWTIVSHEHLTPERIRRLVRSRIAREGWRLLASEPVLADVVEREIREPTEQMAAALGRLPAEHRALLVSLLDAPPGPVGERDLSAAIRRHAAGSLRSSPAGLVDRLSGHFLQVSPTGAVSWAHPSWRDLVIDYVAGDAAERTRFLERCGIDGALLAISTGGGEHGVRRLPLLRGSDDWDALDARLRERLGDPRDAGRILGALRAAARERQLSLEERVELQTLSRAVLDDLRVLWDGSREPVPVGLLEGWLSLATWIVPSPAAPDLTRTWVELLPLPSLDLTDPGAVERTEDWVTMVRALRGYAPALLAGFGFPDAQRPLIDALVERTWALPADDVESRRRAADLMRRLSEVEQSIDCDALAVLMGTAAPAPRPAGSPPRRDRRSDEQTMVTRIMADLGTGPAWPPDAFAG